jgi:hypothetical protein
MKSIHEDHKEIASGKKKDDEGYMARIELDTIERAIKNLRTVIKSSDTQLPAWVQSKITRAADFIDTAAEYLQSDEKLDEDTRRLTGTRGKILHPSETQLKRSTGAGALSPEAAQEIGPKAVELRNKKLKTTTLPTLPQKNEEKLLVQKIIEEHCGCDSGKCNKTPAGKMCPKHGMNDCSINEERDPKGPVQSYKTPKEIAKKHGVPLDEIKTQLKMGIKVEGEHTSDKAAARITALQHLDEVPDYYTKLKKVETQKESKLVRDMFGNVSYEFIDLITANPLLQEKKKDDNPCWPGYKRKKGTRKYETGSCVPVEEQSNLQQKLVEAKLKKAKAEQEYARTIGTLSKQGADPETVTEATLPSQNGHVMSVTVMWRGKYYATQMFFPQVKLPNRREVTDAANKVYPDSKVITYGVSNLQPGMPIVQLPKSKNYLLNNGTIGEDLSEDWQKVNRQDKTDGLSQKAVDAYRSENPGSNLQTAVTEKKPKGKRAKRRKSFCRRMTGMKKKLTSTKTAKDPNSRINKALRRWKCE